MTALPLRLAAFAAAAAVPLCFVLLPIGAFLVMSFWTMQDARIVPDMSLSNYAEFAGNESYRLTFLVTLVLCAKVTLIGLAVGYPIAWAIWRLPSKWRALMLLLFVIPLFMSYIVKIYTMRSILGLNGLLNLALVRLGVIETPSTLFLYNQNAILVTMAVVFLPFVILPIYLSLERIPPSLLAASADLGASPFTTFRRVVLPLSAPGTMAGALFTYVLAMGDFVTPQMVGGPSGFTFGRVIWSQFGLAYNWPFGAALAAVLFLVALLLILAAAAVNRKGGLGQ
jgi:spermidine/putrescine transport system permease protein